MDEEEKAILAKKLKLERKKKNALAGEQTEDGVGENEGDRKEKETR